MELPPPQEAPEPGQPEAARAPEARPTAGDGLTGRHLRSLRRRLALLYAAAMAVALAVLVGVVLRVDSELRWSSMAETLLTRAQEGARSVFFDAEGELVVDRFLADQRLTGDWPQLWVFGADERGEMISTARPEEDWYGVDLRDLARRVMLGDAPWSETVPSDVPEPGAVARGVPVVDPSGRADRAAVVAVVAADDFLADHDRLRSWVLLAAAGLTVAAAAAGHWLAGRGTRATALALAQQERLISDAAHELRTPVAAIRAIAEGGLAGDESPPAALARVARLGEEAGRMVDDLLTLARMDAGRESVSRRLLRLDLLAEEVAASHPEVAVEAVETTVHGDPGLLRRAISNLVRNALQHGVVEGEPPSVKVTVYPNRVMVADRGPGVAGEVAPHLFERFHTGPRSTGHGLGLPIVAWIAEAHGGSARLEYRQGGGTIATLELPD